MTISRTGNTITGTTSDLEAMKARFNRFLMINADGVTISLSATMNKRERAQIDSLIEAINEESAAIDSSVSTSAAAPTRYIELLAKAERLGLNHGKSWVCTGFQVDRDSIDPSFEGEMVCYVYSR